LPTLRLGAELQTNPFSTTISSLPSSKKEVLDALLFENDINNDALPLSAAIKGASGRYRPEHGQHYRTPRKCVPSRARRCTASRSGRMGARRRRC
jgi:hypothetical protein